MTKLKSVLLITIILLSISSNLFSEEVNIRISGEEYSREMPTNIKEAQVLIRQLAEMVNNADDEIVSLNNKMSDERKDYTNKLNDVTAKLDEANKKLEDTEKIIETLDKDTTKLTKVDTRCTPFLIFGPAVNFDKTIGMFFNVGIDYRIFRNLHIGASINSSIFTDTKLDGSIGVGLLIGYSIY